MTHAHICNVATGESEAKSAKPWLSADSSERLSFGLLAPLKNPSHVAETDTAASWPVSWDSSRSILIYLSLESYVVVTI